MDSLERKRLKVWIVLSRFGSNCCRPFIGDIDNVRPFFKKHSFIHHGNNYAKIAFAARRTFLTSHPCREISCLDHLVTESFILFSDAEVIGALSYSTFFHMEVLTAKHLVVRVANWGA